MANNVYEIFRRLAAFHGHMWANADGEEAEVLEGQIASALPTEDVKSLCKDLSNLSEEQVKDLPAPHNSGIRFNPDELYHTTLTGREHWAIIDDRTLVYQVWRPGRIVAMILFHVHGGITVSELDFEDMEERHWDTLINTLIEVLDVNELREAFSEIYKEVRVA